MKPYEFFIILSFNTIIKSKCSSECSIGNTFENKIFGITGDPKKIFLLSQSWGVLSEKIFNKDGNYLINHSSSVLLLKDGKYLDRINHHAKYEDMFKVINKYLR